MSVQSPVSLNPCTLIGRRLHVARLLEPPDRLSKAERRRRSLRRGVALWHADTCARVRTRPRVMRIALTFTADDPAAARGAITQFWRDYRREFGKRPYFSWAELQSRGAVHYHGIMVDPPWILVRHARSWMQAHWPHAQLQPSVESDTWHWFVQRGGAYVRKYANKRPDVPREVDKSYQQRYELLPREIRTYENNRLEHLVAEVKRHVDSAVIVNAFWYAAWEVRRWHYLVIGWNKHYTPPGGRCMLATLNKNGVPPKRHSAIRRITSASTTRELPVPSTGTGRA